jgi:hypothetical protein
MYVSNENFDALSYAHIGRVELNLCVFLVASLDVSGAVSHRQVYKV